MNRRLASAVALAAGVLIAAEPPSIGAGSDPYESPGTFPASRYLTPVELAGTEWKVAPQATSDGLFNHYTIESRFGPLQARGRTMLGYRTKEIEALAELERVSKSEVFTEAVVASAVAPVKVLVSFADDPKETVTGISGGTKRLWSKTKFQAREMTHEAKEGVAKQTGSDGEGGTSTAENVDKAKQATAAYAKKYLGLTKSEHRWYAELGVDPYTDNETLRKAVKEVSRVEAAAKFGMRFAGLPTVPGAREVGMVMDLVWKTDPWELRQRNRKLLLDAGLSEADARAFEDNKAMSPTFQTALLQSLTDLEGVAGRVRVVERASDVDDSSAARMLVSTTALLVRYHRQVGPLAEILPGAFLPVARASDGRLVAVVAADVLYWTPEVAEGVRDFAANYSGDPAKRRELRVAGEASDRFKAEAKAFGWQVLDRWQIGAPEDRQATKKPAS